MNPNLRNACRFGLYACALLPFSLWLYATVLPYYEHGLAVLTNVLLGSTSTGLNIGVAENGGLFTYRPSLGEQPVSSGSDSYDPHVVLLNLAILPVLLLASPGKLSHRIRLVALSVPALLILNAFVLFVLLRTRLCLAANPNELICVWSWGLVMTSGQVLGVAAWALLTWRSWFPSRTEPARRFDLQQPRRNSPCPCGRKLKYKNCCGKA